VSKCKKERLVGAHAAVHDEERIHRGEEDVAPGNAHERVQLGSNLLRGGRFISLGHALEQLIGRDDKFAFCPEPRL